MPKRGNLLEQRYFDRFRDLAYEKAGISLKEGKEALISARVTKRMRKLQLEDFAQYLDYLEGDPSGEELINFLDVISTNFTSFYREPEHFEILTSALMQWAKRGQRRFRIWCAASSSGEEPYTLVMTMLEALGEQADFKLLATDISTVILEKARQGVYPEKVLAPMSKARRLKFFTRLGRRDGGDDTPWQAKDLLKERIVFKRLNLNQPPFPMSGPLDVVFCRNVMIYFDRPVRQALISEIERLLKPGGLLMIGHTETLTGLSTQFRVIQPSVYQKPDG